VEKAMKVGDLVEFGEHPLSGILAGKGIVVEVSEKGTLASVWLFRQQKVKKLSHLLLKVIEG
jgi:riboflavin synthase alpha subunit